MPEKTTVNTELNIIEVVSYGVVTKDDWETTLAEIMVINKNCGIDKVLVNTTRQEIIPELFRVFDFGLLISSKSRSIKFAIVIGHKTRKVQEFLETVTLNRGSNYSIFFERESAMEWLLAK